MILAITAARYSETSENHILITNCCCCEPELAKDILIYNCKHALNILGPPDSNLDTLARLLLVNTNQRNNYATGSRAERKRKRQTFSFADNNVLKEKSFAIAYVLHCLSAYQYVLNSSLLASESM